MITAVGGPPWWLLLAGAASMVVQLATVLPLPRSVFSLVEHVQVWSAGSSWALVLAVGSWLAALLAVVVVGIVEREDG